MFTTYTITQLAKEFGVTTRAIRFYEDQGLLTPRREGRNRIYSKRDWVRLKLVLRGKRLGFTLSEIRDFFDLYDSTKDETPQLVKFLDSLKQRQAILEQQREDIEVVLGEIQALETQCTKLLQNLEKRESEKDRQPVGT
ncbi:MAG: MerR family DNA-binding transcriptional regulator [Betaproteobacteria bacterium]|nr:MerR family DNA-binding transcriptional regulator [Betaproteobacteria bacterium]